MPKTHYLKTWPEYYIDVVSGVKPFEVRKDDRGYQVGDTLVLQEYEPMTQAYTGREHGCVVAYVLRNYPAVAADHVVMGIR